MAKRGKRVVFHGAFGSKAAAKRKEKAGSGRFIVPRTIKGHRRFIVISERSR